MPIFVYTAGQWKPVQATNPDGVQVIWAWKGGWKRAYAAYVHTTKDGVRGWWPAFDQIPKPPTSMRITAATNQEASLAWDAVPGSTGYQVVMQTGTDTAHLRTMTPVPTETTTSYTWPGLLQDTKYTFWAISKNVFGSDSDPSNKVVLTTGHAAVPITKAAFDWLGDASKSDTWNDNKHWQRSGGTVVQGHPDASPGTNCFGCVDYSGLWNQLKKAYPELDDISRVTVDDAEIVRIRRENGAGGDRPALWLYTGSFSLTYDGKNPPNPAGARRDPNVAAPAFPYPAGSGQGENITIPVTWPRGWMNKDSPNNGIIVRRVDDTGNNNIGYDGYCVLSGVSAADPFFWRVRLRIHWDFNNPEYKAPTWVN